MKKIWLHLWFMLLVFTVVFTTVLWNVSGYAKRLHLEQYYQIQWCEGKGEVEVVLKDKTRVDCLTATQAIEFDFGNKWAESLGQALHYGFMTGKKPGIVLILEDSKDLKYWFTLKALIGHLATYGMYVDLWCYPCAGLKE